MSEELKPTAKPAETQAVATPAAKPAPRAAAAPAKPALNELKPNNVAPEELHAEMQR